MPPADPGRRVVVVGAVNADAVRRIDRFPAPGETIRASASAAAFGGKGANVAMAAASLGHATALIAAVGGDDLSTRALEVLRDAGVDTGGCRPTGGTTIGTAIVLVRDDGENCIVIDSGANDWIGLAIDAVAWSGDEVVVAQLEVPTPAVVNALTAARRVGATTVLNASPVPAVLDAAVLAAIAATDVLVVNAGEAAMLLTVAGRGAEGTTAEGIGIHAALAALGPRCVIVTDGARGITGWEGGDVVHVPAVEVAVVDTTGAGDAACAAIAVGMARGDDLGALLRLAAAAGAVACTAHGAQAAYPGLASLAGPGRRDC